MFRYTLTLSQVYPEHLYQVVRVSERFLSHDYLYYHLVDRYWDQELTWIIQRQVRVWGSFSPIFFVISSSAKVKQQLLSPCQECQLSV